MPIQLYKCRIHGYFERQQAIEDRVYEIDVCPVAWCGRACDWQPPTGTIFIIKDGGTGAQKGSR